VFGLLILAVTAWPLVEVRRAKGLDRQFNPDTGNQQTAAPSPRVPPQTDLVSDMPSAPSARPCAPTSCQQRLDFRARCEDFQAQLSAGRQAISSG